MSVVKYVTRLAGAADSALRRVSLAIAALLSPLGVAAWASAADAAEPLPWQMGLQPPASPTMASIESFHTLLLWIITIITIFVLGLLVYVMVKFNEKANPTPSQTTHNTMVEVLWTVIPIVILVAIAVPSFKLLYFTDKTANAEMTLKITAQQWYWSYEYPDQGDIKFDSNMLSDKELKPGQRRLLEVDNRIVLPVGTNIRLLMTSADVIHAWRINAFGVMKDAVPGRLAETWVKIDREGVYYGQCSELCGVNHAFMPVAVEAVSKEKFAAWIVDAKKRFASAPPAASAPQLAATKAD
ncbi:MAG: cytochrome c oxidase subunit II [Alphaproteobacteria bacterium]|nr:cytochrome c oxidase subunit II [Alphaproteobacteria bacterium]